MRIAKKVFKYLVYALTSVLVLFSMYTFIFTKIIGVSYVNIFGYTYFVVATGSMSGTIEVNDIVIVKINDKYQVSDIVTYEEKNTFITHRVKEINKDTIITRGDVNNIDDDPVKKENVIGKVTCIISFESILKAIAIIIILIILYIILNFESIFKKYIINDDKKKKKKKEKTPLEYTQVISLEKSTKIPLVCKDEIEILETEDGMEFVNLVVKNLRIKHKSKKLKLTTDGSLKLKHVYEIAASILIDYNQVVDCIKNKPFDELYDYDFDDISFTKDIQNKLYEMPIYVYLMLLSYSLLYDENELFDAIYKMLKYRILIDPDNKFKKDKQHIDEVLTLIENIAKEVKQIEKFEFKEIKERLSTNKNIKNISTKK